MLMPTYGDSGQQKQFTTMQEGNYSFSCIAVDLSKRLVNKPSVVMPLYSLCLCYSLLYSTLVQWRRLLNSLVVGVLLKVEEVEVEVKVGNMDVAGVQEVDIQNFKCSVCVHFNSLTLSECVYLFSCFGNGRGPRSKLRCE